MFLNTLRNYIPHSKQQINTEENYIHYQQRQTLLPTKGGSVLLRDIVSYTAMGICMHKM
jgi:hypothetical protein